MVLRLPEPKGGDAPACHDHTEDEWFQERYGREAPAGASVSRPAAKPVPPYGKRSGLAPRRQEDYGDGGAFPEVLVAQYHLDMGRRDGGAQGSNALTLTVDGRGRVAFDAVVRQGENALKIVYSSPGDVVPKIAAPDAGENDHREAVEEATARTNAALQVIIHTRLSAVQPANIRPHNRGPAFVQYKPARQSAAFNSGAAERIVRVEQTQEDPILPAKHKYTRVPRPAGPPPVTVLRSPPRSVSRKDQEDWKIPTRISNWKNPKGYSIPLDKRLASDGRGLQDVRICDAFAGLSEALYTAEQKAREAVQMRAMVQRELRMKENEQREQELCQLANKARAERTDAARAPPVGAEQSKARVERDMIREERRHERERERRMEARAAAGGKKSKGTRDRDRDVSERIALGMASTGSKSGGEVTYYERLFNQDRGMDSGFAADDQYNVYSGRLFAAQPTLYKPNRHGDSDIYGDAGEQLEKIIKTGRFKPDKGFSGAPERPAGKRERPVEFDEPEEDDDPFHLDQFLTQVKKGNKQ